MTSSAAGARLTRERDTPAQLHFNPLVRSPKRMDPECFRQ